ncbi:MAG: DMT family transporter [Alphaproteobacteria bacterium]|nr:DMT family transporter [Alphaproteobacteria bacterium]
MAEGTARGIALLAASTIVFTAMDLQAQYLSRHYPTSEIAFARYVGNLIIVALIFLPRRGLRLLHTRRLGLQLLRSALLVICTFGFFFSLRYMPLADAVAIGLVSPIIVTALSRPLLKERIGWRRWTAVAIGFAGALVIVRPGLGTLHWSASVVLLVAFCYALFQILTRKLAEGEDSVTTLFYSALVGTVGLALPLPFEASGPQSAWHLLLLASLGLWGTLGGFLLIRAFVHAPAVVLAPLTYLSLPTSALGGLLIFGDFPDGWTWLGAGILIATGLYIFHRERLRGGAG